jgi:ABC-type multidrug transport system fused ATPase/permease subunit
MGLVSQECLLFQGTIEDNIRYGTDHATSAQVVEAAQAAYAHEFIMAMPHVSHLLLTSNKEAATGSASKGLFHGLRLHAMVWTNQPLPCDA